MDYRRWQILNENLGFPLGVSSLNSLGISGGFQSYEEGKKKKMVGDEIELDKGEDEPEQDADEDDGEPKKKLPPWLQKKDKGHEEPDGDECACKGPHTEMCRKHMKKKASKKMQSEMFSAYEDCQFAPMPEVGTDEYRAAFYKSIQGHMGEPNKRFSSGVNLGEEVIFEPKDEQMPEPQAGQVGYAPTGRVGGELGPPASQMKPEWEQQWKPLADEMQGFIDQWDTARQK